MKGEKKGLRPEKISEAAELSARVSSARYMIFADYSGMDMSEITALRKSLRENGAIFNVVKNRMLNRAISHDVSGWLKGPTAMIFSKDGDVIEAAKNIRNFSVRNKKIVIKGGFIEGQILSDEDVVTLAMLPSGDVLRAQLLGTLQAPSSQMVGVFNQKLVSLIYVLSAVKNKKSR